MDSNSPFGAGENPMASMFSDPNLLGKLASNPRTSKFMADPSFVQKIKDLQSGKSQADMANILQDQRMLAVLGVAMGVDMVSHTGSIWVVVYDVPDINNLFLTIASFRASGRLK